MEFNEFVNVRNPDQPPLYVRADCVVCICAQAQGPGATIGLTNGNAFMSRDTAENITKRVETALHQLRWGWLAKC